MKFSSVLQSTCFPNPSGGPFQEPDCYYRCHSSPPHPHPERAAWAPPHSVSDITAGIRPTHSGMRPPVHYHVDKTTAGTAGLSDLLTPPTSWTVSFLLQQVEKLTAKCRKVAEGEHQGQYTVVVLGKDVPSRGTT